MTSHINPLHPDNKIEFADGDRVEVALAGFIDNVVTGTIIGMATTPGVIDNWIVLLDTKLPTWPYRAIVVGHPFIRRDGANEPFLCQGRDRFE